MVRKSVFPSQPPYPGHIPSAAVCYRCGRPYGLHRHHIFAGSLRNISEREGLWVYLCHECHESPIFGIHAKVRSKGHRYTDDEHLRWHAQHMWECNKAKSNRTWEQAREEWKAIAKSGMPSYDYVQDDKHGMWLHEWTMGKEGIQ